MIRCGPDGHDPVRARWKTVSYVDRDGAVGTGRVIYALEESKFCRVERLGRRERAYLLDDHMGVTDDLAIIVYLLWRRVISRIRIREFPQLHVLNCQCHRERCVGFQGVEVLGGYVFARGYVGDTCDLAHRDWVARAIRDLLAIGDRLSGAEIDKVIGGGQRGGCAGGCVVQAVTFGTVGDHSFNQALKEVS